MKYTIEESNLKESDLLEDEEEVTQESKGYKILIWTLSIILVLVVVFLGTIGVLMYIDKSSQPEDEIVEDRQIEIKKDFDCDVSYELVKNETLFITIKTTEKVSYMVIIYTVYDDETQDIGAARADTVMAKDVPNEYTIEFTCKENYNYIIDVKISKYEKSLN